MMEYNDKFALDCAPWHDFVIQAVAKSKTCQVKGWSSISRSVDQKFLSKTMAPIELGAGSG